MYAAYASVTFRGNGSKHLYLKCCISYSHWVCFFNSKLTLSCLKRTIGQHFSALTPSEIAILHVFTSPEKNKNKNKTKIHLLCNFALPEA